MSVLRKIWAYITFQKQDEEGVEQNFNLKAMHTINKISIFMFIVAIVVLLVKWFG